MIIKSLRDRGGLGRRPGMCTAGRCPTGTAWIPCEVGPSESAPGAGQLRRLTLLEGGCLPASAPRLAPALGWGCAGDVSQGL